MRIRKPIFKRGPRHNPLSRLEALERRQLLAATAFISEVQPSGSGNGTYAADWFELTNPTPNAIDITGWKMDDNSNAAASAVALRGITSIPAGRSAVFFEGNATGTTDATILAAFSKAWFGTDAPPADLLIGAYGGTGVGLGGGGDSVNIFDAAGNRVTGVSFAAATAARTFENTTGLGSTTLPLPTLATLSTATVNGAFLSSNGAETGSPGRTITGVDLAQYVRIGRFDLPEPKRTTAPANSRLAQEVSAVTYDWDTDTLFVVGDGGTSIVQVSKTGQLIDSMTLSPGDGTAGSKFADTEGLAYVGGGKFVMVEERERQVDLFTYVPGGTLTRADVQTVDLGTFQANTGLEGLSFDPQTGGFIVVKETDPEGIFQTGVDFAAGTATNGSPSTENSVNLFNPAVAGVLDFADVYALSNTPTLRTSPDSTHLLLLSQESGKILNIDRSGHIFSTLTIISDPENPLSVAGQQHEGVAMDPFGFLYVVSENGGGDVDHPQLWVYAPSAVPNQAPTALTLKNQVNLLSENTGTATRLKVADIVITDDGLGDNNLTIAGPDAAFFEADSTGLYLKAGTVLDFETKSSYSVSVVLDDTTVGATPDATADFTLNLIDVINEDPAHPSLIISEVAPWSSGSSPIAADWFEVTNISDSAIDLGGWKVDDNSNSFGAAVPLAGISSIAPGESVIFIETNDLPAKSAAFLANWFGTYPPTHLQIGSYTGSGIGLGTGGDTVNLYSPFGLLQANVVFGASPTGPDFATFDNAAALNNTTISTLSAAGANGAFVAVNSSIETGSPGTIDNEPPIAAADSITLAEDSAATFNVLSNDSDADGDTITLLSHTNTAHGTLTDNANGSFTYTPAPNFNGADSFTYTIGDGNGRTATNTVTIRVLSPAEQIADLSGMVAGLHDRTALNGGQANSLLKKLANAQNALTQGKSKIAISTLGALKSEILSMLNEGVLTTQDANTLLSAAEALLQSLSIN